MIIIVKIILDINHFNYLSEDPTCINMKGQQTGTFRWYGSRKRTSPRQTKATSANIGETSKLHFFSEMLIRILIIK